MTRLVNADKYIDPENEEVIDIALTSSNPKGEHNVFNKCLGKKMRVLINFIDA